MSPKKVEPEPKPVPEEKSDKKKGKKKDDEVQLPMMVEVVFSFSNFFLIVTSIAVFSLSLASGAALVEVISRTIITTIALGMVLWLIAMGASNGMMQSQLPNHPQDHKRSGDSTHGEGQNPSEG